MLIKEKHIPIANLDRFKPSQVVEEVRKELPFRFTMGTHTMAWKHYEVRPASRAAKPEQTRSEYCSYDVVHADYVYTKAWVRKLLRDMSTKEGYRAVVGRDPLPV